MAPQESPGHSAWGTPPTPGPLCCPDLSGVSAPAASPWPPEPTVGDNACLASTALLRSGSLGSVCPCQCPEHCPLAVSVQGHAPLCPDTLPRLRPSRACSSLSAEGTIDRLSAPPRLRSRPLPCVVRPGPGPLMAGRQHPPHPPFPQPCVHTVPRKLPDQRCKKSRNSTDSTIHYISSVGAEATE